MKILNRWTDAVIFESATATTMSQLIAEAIAKAKAERGSGARAYLVGANLTGAYLVDANLAGADLAGADLTDAYLVDARNLPSGTEATDPPTPYVRDTSPKTRAERAQRYRERNPNVPVVERLDAKILERIEGGEGHLDMQSWHSCETTHCRAGWAIHLAGEAGYKLEATYGSQHAGAMIYRASTGRVPHFFASNERALEDIRRCAAEQTEVP
jgi:hypothetical protein